MTSRTSLLKRPSAVLILKVDASPPRLEEYQVEETYDKTYEDTYKVKKGTPEACYEWHQDTYEVERVEEAPRTEPRAQAQPLLVPIKFFKPSKRGEKPSIKCFDPQTVNRAIFKEACQGVLSGYEKPVRGIKHATATLYYARDKGIRGICCSGEIHDGGEETVKYQSHLVGLPWALRDYTVPCGGCHRNIWEVACPARCATCGPTLVVHQQEIDTGRV
ncbi:hypothetical protein TKK_0001702 [Trichogramma kaykai]